MRESGIPEIPHDLPRRAYTATFAELVDRLSIVQLKAIFIPEHKVSYQHEMKLIVHDLDAILAEKSYSIKGEDLRTIIVLAICNRVIWENESIARAGGQEAEGRLRLTHSINGSRNTAKNILAHAMGDRKDLKIDCLAADLPNEYGNWAVFE